MQSLFAALGLGCASGVSLGVVSRGSSVAVVASLAEEHRLQGMWAAAVVAHGLSCPMACGIFLEQGLDPCPLPCQANS